MQHQSAYRSSLHFSLIRELVKLLNLCQALISGPEKALNPFPAQDCGLGFGGIDFPPGCNHNLMKPTEPNDLQKSDTQS